MKFKPRKVNDSSQSNQGTDHLVSQVLPHNEPTFEERSNKNKYKFKHHEGSSRLK
jgi:hypothetical protein